jgi:hypothetical protein
MPEEIKDGEVTDPVVEQPKKTIGWKAGFAAGCIAAATTLVGVEKGVLEPQLEARQIFVVDSIAREDSIVTVLADSINAANASPARYAAVRPQVSGNQKTDKFNPPHYHAPDEFCIVKTYRGRQGSKDTVLINEVLVEADAHWLLVSKAAAVLENPPQAESVAGEIEAVK